MSGPTISTGQPFVFTPENRARAEHILARYPHGRQHSAVIPLLDLAQRQNGGWLSHEAIEFVARMIAMAPMRALEVATFYTMFNLKPVGRNLIQVCRTTPCWLRGSDHLTRTCMSKLGIGLKESTPEGLFTLVEVECLGACVNAPVVQVNDDLYEDLDPARMERLLEALARDEKPPHGSQSGRQNSAPEGAWTSLTSTVSSGD
ncbi:MAG TPA: NADH-quinone oxidoreductase subunit NuoE [Alphaproteobacteria bacterium]|nr:NADH-quinone oxidoreductase subunit NuoE [Alphaproteobacteria bacterium]